jgi:hypothetical protein
MAMKFVAKAVIGQAVRGICESIAATVRPESRRWRDGKVYNPPALSEVSAGVIDYFGPQVKRE